LIDLVLYLDGKKLWKIAGFGLSSNVEGKNDCTTERGQGTSGYRAPEILQRLRFSPKVDIWALGCILYEVMTRNKAFNDDWTVFEHAHYDKIITFPNIADLGIQGPFILAEVRQMLLSEPTRRPDARSLLPRFYSRAQVAFQGRVPAPETCIPVDSSHNLLPESPLGSFLLHSCGHLMSKIWTELEKRRLIGPDKVKVTGGVEALTCLYWIGGGGEGNVYEV